LDISEENEKLPELIKINVDYGCYGKRCEDCGKFFECLYPKKYEMYKHGRVEKIKEKMSRIKHKVAVMSGKGGVGKSTVTSNLAIALARMKLRVGVVDSDFHGPCIPKILGVKNKKVKIGKDIIPANGPLDIKVISTAFFVDDDEAIQWFHDLKRGALEEFLAHVDYGELDYLLIDLPPGTGAEPVNLMKYIQDLDGAIVVTIPSEVSQDVAKRGISNLNVAKVKTIGVIENMCGFVCQCCGEVVNIFQYGGGERLAKEMEVPFLGRIPLDERVSATSDNGVPFIVEYPDSSVSEAFMDIVDKIRCSVEEGE
jgi:ATP-binding protein involved in chromosome partitioning